MKKEMAVRIFVKDLLYHYLLYPNSSSSLILIRQLTFMANIFIFPFAVMFEGKYLLGYKAMYFVEN